jgi:hypothetical protein
VSATPGSALVFQEGNLVGATPIELTLDPSGLPARYQVKARGYVEQDLTIDSMTGEETQIVLKPVAKRAAPAPGPARASSPPMDDVGDPFKRK